MPEDFLLESYPSAVVQAKNAAPQGTPASRCVVCKGRLFCGMQSCPILSSVQATYRDMPPCERETDAMALDVTLGAETFPHDPAGLTIGMRPLSEARDRADAFGIIKQWYYATSGSDGAHDLELQGLALSDTPVEVAVSWKDRPHGGLRFSASEPPRGRHGTIGRLEVIGRPHVPGCVPALLGRDQPAEQAIVEGYDKGLSPEYLSRLHALGMFGSPPWQIPSRWAMSAAYNVCSKRAIQRCKEYSVIGESQLYTAEGMGDRIAIVLLPRPWEFELVEVWHPNTLWTLGERKAILVNEHETHRGVSDQALREGGSYFASRMSVVTLLDKEKRQAAALILRAPHPQGSVPLGSEVLARTMETAARAGSFGTEDEAVQAACAHVGIDAGAVLRHSMTMQQDTLSRWF